MMTLAPSLLAIKDIHPHPSPSLADGPLSMDVQRMKPIILLQARLPMMITGPTNCGKTYWINCLLTNDMFTQPVASILYCYSMYQEFFNTMKEDPSIACPRPQARNTYRCSMQEDKNPKEVEKYMQAQGGVQVSTFSCTQQKHSPV